MESSSSKTLMTVLVIIALAAVAWFVMTMPDRRTTGERIGDAVDAAPQGLDKSARELEDRTPGERVGDAVKDTGEAIKEKTDR